MHRDFLIFPSFLFIKMPHKDKLVAKEWHRNRHLLLTYGITSKQYDDMLLEQKGVCKLCGFKRASHQRAFHVDHDHKNNKLRGLICRSCNRYVIGGIEAIGLKKITDYLGITYGT